MFEIKYRFNEGDLVYNPETKEDCEVVKNISMTKCKVSLLSSNKKYFINPKYLIPADEKEKYLNFNPKNSLPN